MKKVFVSGCYDLLHSGHVEFFKQASAMEISMSGSVPTKRMGGVRGEVPGGGSVPAFHGEMAADGQDFRIE